MGGLCSRKDSKEPIPFESSMTLSDTSTSQGSGKCFFGYQKIKCLGGTKDSKIEGKYPSSATPHDGTFKIDSRKLVLTSDTHWFQDETIPLDKVLTKIKLDVDKD